MSGGVPAGWVLVPVEPTAEMIEAAVEHWHTHNDFLDDEVKGTYAAMLSAVPTPTPPIEGRDADVERVEVVAKAMAPLAWHPFEPRLHGSPVARRQAQEMWRKHARTAIAALQALGERG